MTCRITLIVWTVACRYGADAAMYGLLLRHGAGPSCEDAAVQELLDMLKMVCESLYLPYCKANIIYDSGFCQYFPTVTCSKL